MKITVVTFHRAQNHGAVLQCFALNKMLQKLGVECKTLDYYPQCFKEWYCYKKKFSLRHPPIKTWFINCILHGNLKKRNKVFTEFVERYIPLTEMTLDSKEKIESYKSDTDIYIAGSDMLWNAGCCRFDPVYFLDFPDAKGKKCVSYAVSFGDTPIPDELVPEYKRRLSSFESISVREESGKNKVYDLIQKDAVINCDPTLLLKSSEWINTFSLSLLDEHYILVYYVEKTQDMQRYAKSLGRRVYGMSCNMSFDVMVGKNDKKLCDEFVSDASPLEFLQAVYNSEAVITNSFHGLVFALIFHKPFLVKLENDGHTNMRAKALMEMTGTLEREFMKCDIYDSIDWKYVDKVLAEIRAKSMAYLEELLK